MEGLTMSEILKGMGTMEIYDVLKDQYKDYNKTFAKYGIRLTEIASLQDDINKGLVSLTVTIKYYRRTSSGRWSSKPYKTETLDYAVDQYLNTITSIPMFKDRVTREYLKWGYIPTRLSCVSWGDASTKAVREFTFKNL
jgi:hypothetical protein